jgi:hypothetical protein
MKRLRSQTDRAILRLIAKRVAAEQQPEGESSKDGEKVDLASAVSRQHDIDRAVEPTPSSRPRRRKRILERYGSCSSARSTRRVTPHMWESRANMAFPSPLHHRSTALVTASYRSTMWWALSGRPAGSP